MVKKKTRRAFVTSRSRNRSTAINQLSRISSLRDLLYNLFYLNLFENSLNTWKVKKTVANNVQNREITWHTLNEIRMPFEIQHYESSINNCIQICSHTQYRYMIIVHISSGKHCVIDVCLYVTYICMYVRMYMCIYT